MNEARVQAALDHCRGMIRDGSKSFALASLLFDAERRDAAFFLYGWCRHCDDEVDGSPFAEASERPTVEKKRERLAALREKTARAFGPLEQVPDEPVFLAFHEVIRRYGVPRLYAEELLEGMAMDAEGAAYLDSRTLQLYCWRVASVVGLMMCHVMGVSTPKALKKAADLGIAMQLTNIARDVATDAAMGRVYLPEDWLRAEGLSPDPKSLMELRNREALVRVVGRLLDLAEQFYRSGNSGIRFLNFRSALAVSAASAVYRQIGRWVRRRGASAWDSRTVVPSAWKRWALVGAVLRQGVGLPVRWLRPWARASLQGQVLEFSSEG